MGSILRYTATLKRYDLLPYLLEELQELADDTGWQYSEVPLKTYRLPAGQSFQTSGALLQIHPKSTMPLNFVFDTTGLMVNHIMLIALSRRKMPLQDIPDDLFPNAALLRHLGETAMTLLASKTDDDSHLRYAMASLQFAGAWAHITACKLLQYLGGKYFAAIDVIDSTDYWQTGEAEKLMESINISNAAAEHFNKFFDTEARKFAQGGRMTFGQLIKDMEAIWQKIRKDLPHKGR